MQCRSTAIGITALMTKVIPVLVVLFLLLPLLIVCAISPWLGTDSRDSQREPARSTRGWYPPLSQR